MKLPFLPVIIGSDENAYGMARAFHERYDVRSLLLCRAPLIPTRYSRIVDIRIIDGLDDSDTFIKQVSAVGSEMLSRYEKLVLVPCADRYTELAVLHRERLAGFFCNPFISKELLDCFVTKDRFYQLCDRHGLCYPKTVVVPPGERLAAVDSLPFGYPIIVKANNSNSYDFLHAEFEGKKKVWFINSREEYIQIITAMNTSAYRDNLIVQEFVPGDDTAMRVVNCYCGSDGKVRLICVGRPILEEYAPLTLGNYAAILTEREEAICQSVKTFLEGIGYVGFANFDLKYDHRTGEYKLFEINPRQGRSSFFVTAAGYNLAEFLAEDTVYGKSCETVYADPEERLWLTLPKKLLFRYVDNGEILRRVSDCIKKKAYTYTLLYKKDLSLMRRLRMWRYYNRQVANYRRYFFKK